MLIIDQFGTIFLPVKMHEQVLHTEPEALSIRKYIPTDCSVSKLTYDGTDGDYDFPIASWCKTNNLSSNNNLPVGVKQH